MTQRLYHLNDITSEDTIRTEIERWLDDIKIAAHQRQYIFAVNNVCVMLNRALEQSHANAQELLQAECVEFAKWLGENKWFYRDGRWRKYISSVVDHDVMSVAAQNELGEMPEILEKFKLKY